MTDKINRYRSSPPKKSLAGITAPMYVCLPGGFSTSNAADNTCILASAGVVAFLCARHRPCPGPFGLNARPTIPGRPSNPGHAGFVSLRDPKNPKSVFQNMVRK